MRSISERDLAAVIPLLALKIRDLERELADLRARPGALTEAEVDEQMQIQDVLAQYDGILDSLREEYEQGWAEGLNLPSYDELTRRLLASRG